MKDIEVLMLETRQDCCTRVHIQEGRLEYDEVLPPVLGLSKQQKDDGIFISQDNYVADILKNFDFATIKIANTPIKTNKHCSRMKKLRILYIGSKLSPQVSHLHAVKRIFRYLKGHQIGPDGIPKIHHIDLEAYNLIVRLCTQTICASLLLKQNRAAIRSGKTQNGKACFYLLSYHSIKQDNALIDKKKVIITETSIRSDLKLDDAEGIDCPTTACHFLQTRLQEKVLDLEKAKTAQAKEITSLKKRVSIGKEKRDELESDKLKKQKIDEHVEAEKDDDPKEEDMKKHMEIVQDEEEIAIDAIPLATKPPMIVEYKIVKEGQKGFYHLIRADGSSKRYSSMIRMLQGIDIEKT
ncbi:hypothetical protein Tco_0339441 [Tanacetum coccineum]